MHAKGDDNYPIREQAMEQMLGTLRTEVDSVDFVEDSVLDDDDKIWLIRMKDLPFSQKPSILKIGVVVFLVGTILGCSAPLEQVVLYKLACQSLAKYSPTNSCDPVAVQELVTNFAMWNGIISSAVLIASTAKVCQLLDEYGRKFFITTFVLFLFVGKTIVYLAMSNSDGMPVWWMWFGTFVAFMFGGTLGLSALCKAYVADITLPEERIYALGVAMTCLALGNLFGPVVSGVLLKIAKKDLPGFVPGGQAQTTDGGMTDGGHLLNAVPRLLFVPIQASLLLALTLFLFCLFFLTESRSEKSRTKSRSASIALAQAPQMREFHWTHKVADFLRPLRILSYPEEFRNRHNEQCFGRTRGAVVTLVAVDCTSVLILEVVVVLGSQYCIYRYNWDSVMLSYNLILVLLISIVLFMVISPVLMSYVFPKLLGLKTFLHTLDRVDSLVLVTTSLINSVAIFGQAIAPNTKTYVGFTAFGAFSDLSTPTLASAITKFFPSSKTGELYGALSFAQCLVTLIFPPLFSQVFAFGVRKGFPGLPFASLSVLSLVCTGAVLTCRNLLKGHIRDP